MKILKNAVLLLLSLMLVVSLAACGGESGESGENGEDGNGGAAQGEAKNGGDDGEYVFNITEDDHTIIWEIETTKFIFTHDGTNVTSYTTYLDMEDKETADEIVVMYKTLIENNTDEGFKEVYRKGTYVVVEYEQEAFPYTTYEELKETADIMKSIKQ